MLVVLGHDNDNVPDDKMDDFDRGGQLDVQTEIVNDSHSIDLSQFFAERNYDPEACFKSFNSTWERPDGLLAGRYSTRADTTVSVSTPCIYTPFGSVLDSTY
jgi:hypothetical protein